MSIGCEKVQDEVFEGNESGNNRSGVQECVISLMKSVQEEMHGMGRRDVSLFLEELDEILGEMKEGVRIESAVDECWNEIETLSNEEILERMKITNMNVGSDDDDHYNEDDNVLTKTNRSEVQTNIDTGDKEEHNEEHEINVSKMKTRSKGPVKEHK